MDSTLDPTIQRQQINYWQYNIQEKLAPRPNPTVWDSRSPQHPKLRSPTRVRPFEILVIRTKYDIAYEQGGSAAVPPPPWNASTSPRVWIFDKLKEIHNTLYEIITPTTSLHPKLDSHVKVNRPHLIDEVMDFRSACTQIPGTFVPTFLSPPTPLKASVLPYSALQPTPCCPNLMLLPGRQSTVVHLPQFILI